MTALAVTIDADDGGVERDVIASPDTRVDAKLRLARLRFVDISHSMPDKIQLIMKAQKSSLPVGLARH
ncbi:MAG: hypothetical protein ACLPTZ_20900 [Beijerinckiaceae bacterium]